MKKNKKLFVKYDHITADVEGDGEVLIQGTGDYDTIIHNKFKKFWGNGTTTIERGTTYERDDGCVFIKIRSVQEVPIEEWSILKKYIVEI